MERLAKLLSVVLVTLYLTLTSGQRTSLRTCDCEYTVDGKCAYTLMLPLSNKEGATPVCPGDSGSPGGDAVSNERLDDLERSIDLLELNMTQVNQWNMQNSQLLLTLQNRVMKLQERLSETNRSTSNDIGDSGSGDPDTTGQSAAELQSQLDRQNDRINSVVDNVNTLADTVALVRSDYQKLESDLTTVTTAYEGLNANYDDLVTSLESKNQQIAHLSDLLDNYTKSGAVCRQRGLLVDGVLQSITLEQIQTSSVYDPSHGPDKIRIHYTEGSGPGAWCPQEPNQDEEWIQFDLGTSRVLYGVVTKGRADYAQWVTSYKIQYGLDNAEELTTFKDIVGDDEIFTGNDDQNTARTNMFWQPIRARYIRFVPLSSYASRNKCLRADVIGCLDA